MFDKYSNKLRLMYTIDDKFRQNNTNLYNKIQICTNVS